MSYTKITLAGRELALSFNNYAIEQAYSFTRGSSALAFGYACIWGGLEGWCFAKNEDITKEIDNPDKPGEKMVVKITFGDVVEWIESETKDVRVALINTAIETMTKAKAYQDLVAPSQQEEVKAEKKTGDDNSLSNISSP